MHDSKKEENLSSHQENNQRENGDRKRIEQKLQINSIEGKAICSVLHTHTHKAKKMITKYWSDAKKMRT